ncbi:hypothetical protein ACPZ19_07090 [Amycolatopsis lurida]
MTGAIHDHGFPPHHSHNATAAAHTAGTSRLTTTRTQAHTAPAPVSITSNAQRKEECGKIRQGEKAVAAYGALSTAVAYWFTVLAARGARWAYVRMRVISVVVPAAFIVNGPRLRAAFSKARPTRS